MNASIQLKALVASLATVAIVGTAMAQGTPPNPAVKNPALGAGQQSTQNTPMGTTGTPGVTGGTTTGSSTMGTGTTSGSTMTGSSTTGSGTTMGASSSTDTTTATKTTRTMKKSKMKAKRKHAAHSDRG
ncbi:proteophosphoglycan ppg4 [Ramlibacter sp.]|uniref:proteophosphoglycan ppg4 n=1 Tax=Ramlibacter sp. TaxID=1917967 RepID=UPI001846FA7B|nr:proteophosphoglycan ppg4 [Ramlibacter sp.]MBA2673020.1 proteophosphoglycan ppg4 [Ramlibacter sp.]